MANVKESSPPNPPLTPPPLPVSCDGSQQLEHKEPSSLTSNYTILSDLGEGSFGKVTRCMKLDTSETVAVKIPKDNDVAKEEVSMLKLIRCLDPDSCNIVKFYESFLLDGKTCLVFELLGVSLFHYWEQRAFTPLQLNDIRSMIQQMATAFKALKTIGVIHTDLKLDNIMLVDHQKEPFRVKLIDFGLALLKSEAEPGDNIQPLPFKSPEILLGLPYSEAIDMWALGCLMALLFLRYPLFPGKCEYDVMRFIIDILGQPSNHLLAAGLKSKAFFKNNRSYICRRRWRLKKTWEYGLETGIIPKESRCYTFSSLDDLTELNLEKGDGAEVADRRELVDLLKQMLQMDASERMTPSGVLTHPFITMSHLTNSSHHSSHGKSCCLAMCTCFGRREASPPAITMQRDSETVDDRPAQPIAFEPSSSQAQTKSKGSKKSTEVDDCPREPSTEAQPGVILVQPNPHMATSQSDGATGQETNCQQVSPQADLFKVSSSQESLSEGHLAVTTEGTPSVNTTEVEAPAASPAVDSTIMAPSLVPLSSPVADPAIDVNQAALNHNSVVDTDSAHSTSEVSKPKKKKKKGVRRFFSRFLRALCCCGAAKVEDVE